MSENIIKVTGIKKYFGGVKALDGVDLVIKKGEVHCLAGENGCGKSTIINIISGFYTPDAGTIEIDGNVCQIIEFQHVKPGKGAAFVRTKLKDIINGGVKETTFRPTEKFPAARIDKKDMQYLYQDGDIFNFMDSETYEQIGLTKDQIGDSLKFVKENETCKVMSYNGNVFAVEPPMFVELTITETEPGFKGDTATGANVSVPLFVNEGDVIKIDTRTGEYLSRV